MEDKYTYYFYVKLKEKYKLFNSKVMKKLGIIENGIDASEVIPWIKMKNEKDFVFKISTTFNGIKLKMVWLNDPEYFKENIIEDNTAIFKEQENKIYFVVDLNNTNNFKRFKNEPMIYFLEKRKDLVLPKLKLKNSLSFI